MGKANIIAKEMQAYNLQVLGISETRWIHAGKMKLTSRELILHSGHPDDSAHHTEGVALMLGLEAQKALIG